MLRHVRAFAWLRWRIMWNGLTKRKGKDTLETLSRIGTVLTGLFVVLFLLPACVGFAGLAIVGGKLISSNPDVQEGTLAITRVMLLILTAAIVIAPVVRSGIGQSINLDRLLLLPIHRRTLHLSETASALTDPWILILLPALFTFPLGLFLDGEPLAGLLMLACGVLFALVMALLGALVSFAAVLLFRKRRRAELITLVLFTTISIAAFLPALFSLSSRDPAEDGDREGRRSAIEEKMPRLTRTFPLWSRPLPSEMYARALYLGSEGQVARALVPAGCLALTGIALYGLSLGAYRRMLEQPELGSPGRTRSVGKLRTFRLPLVSPAVAAMAVLQFRVAIRTIRMRSSIFMIPVMLLLLYFLVTRRLDLEPPPWLADQIGPAMAQAGIVLGFLALQPLQLNQFASDRTGLNLIFVSQLSNREILYGKTIACGFLYSIFLLLCTLAGIIFFPGGSPFLLLAALANVPRCHHQPGCTDTRRRPYAYRHAGVEEYFPGIRANRRLRRYRPAAVRASPPHGGLGPGVQEREHRHGGPGPLTQTGEQNMPPFGGRSAPARLT